jgi:hydroxypyruvate isomerase
MPDFAANLSSVYTELPDFERCMEAARAGFGAVEALFPYAVPKEELGRQLRDCRLSMVAFHLPAGDWTGGERGIACNPGREAEFREGVRRAIDYAAGLGCWFLTCLAGPLPPGVDESTARAALTQNLGFAARLAAAANIRILLHPVSPEIVPRSYVQDLAQAAALLDAVGARNLGLHYNVGHVPFVARYFSRIGHIEIGGWEGAADGGDRAFDHDAFYDLIDLLGHHGWVGCGSAASLDASMAWMARKGRRPVPCRWGIPLQAFRLREASSALG